MVYQLVISIIYLILRRKSDKSGGIPTLWIQKLKFQSGKQLKSAQNVGNKSKTRFPGLVNLPVLFTAIHYLCSVFQSTFPQNKRQSQSHTSSISLPPKFQIWKVGRWAYILPVHLETS